MGGRGGHTLDEEFHFGGGGRTIVFLNMFFSVYCIQHCFICRPSDSNVSEDAGIEPRTVATSALAVRRSNHQARSHPHVLTFTVV
jgi:hypothetical protein